MKKHFILSISILFAVQFSQAQTSCSKYYTMAEGISLKYANYDKKGKEDGQLTYRVAEVTTSGDKVTATIEMEISNLKGNTNSSTYGISCEGDAIKVDFRSLLNEQMLDRMGQGEVEINGKDLELPNELSVGQILPNGNVELKMKMAGAIAMNMNVETLNRKVEKKESLTTPAGTFDCFVIYAETRTKMMVGNQVFPSRTWLAEGVGMVKQESYNAAGKLVGSSLLTEFKK